MQSNLKTHLLVYLSMFGFFVFDSVALVYQFHTYFPSFFILAFIYWNLALPEKLNLSFPLIMGISYDFLLGSLIGTFPLIFIIISYFSQKYFYQFRPMRFIQQSVIILVVFLIIELLLGITYLLPFSISLEFVDSNYVQVSFLSALINAITWPCIFYSLRSYRRKWISG